MLKVLFVFFLGYASITPSVVAGPVTVRGSVKDAATGEPLPSVNVRILGTSHGTVTNAKGGYSLQVEPGRARLQFSFIGYLPDSVTVAPVADTIINIRLHLSPIQMPEVVVSSEDPAVEIIRKAIAHKHEWMEKLKTYQFDAFTRSVIRRDTVIASITESYTTGYMQAGDTLREIIRQKRQTENIPGSDNFTSVRRILNFNEDEIVLLKLDVDDNDAAYIFTGPTAPDALDNYEYKLLNTSTVNGVETYKIQMTPKSKYKPLFRGTISIAEGTYAVMGVDVRPNEIFAIPFIKDLTLHYEQQFGLYQDEFWMPTNIRITGGLTVGLPGFSMPHAGIEITSSIYDYTVNAPIPDSILHGNSLRIDSSATKFDSTYWKNNEVLPLTDEERDAYGTLDSTQTLEKQFEVKGPFGGLGNDKSWSATDLIDLRFNRVEGFFTGLKYDGDVLDKHLQLAGAIGYGFSDKAGKFDAKAIWYPSASRKFGIGAEAYRSMDHIPDEGYYAPVAIGIASLFNKNDYRDYFLTNGFRGFITAKPGKRIEATVGFVSEHQQTVSNNTDFSIFNRSGAYRLNPAINDGDLRAIQLHARFGDEPVPLGFISRKFVEFSIEHSSPSLASSEFDYTRYQAGLTWSIRTFAKKLLFAPALQVRVVAGTSSGTLPVQRMFGLESRLSGYAPFGVLKAGQVKEFGGDRYVMFAAEHNFRSLPFIALGLPFLYKNNIELIVHGAAAQSWFGTVSTSNGWYGEAGIGFSRIFELIRADITYRMVEPKGVWFSLGVAQVF